MRNSVQSITLATRGSALAVRVVRFAACAAAAALLAACVSTGGGSRDSGGFVGDSMPGNYTPATFGSGR